MGTKLSPIHPGEILLEDFLNPMGISQYRLAQDIKVPPRRINEIVHGLRGISADTAMRLAHYFGMTAEFWMNLQSRYDLEILRDQIGSRLMSELKVYHPAADGAVGHQEATRWNEPIHLGVFQSFFTQKEEPISVENQSSSKSPVSQDNRFLSWKRLMTTCPNGNVEVTGRELCDSSQEGNESQASKKSTDSPVQKDPCFGLAA